MHDYGESPHLPKRQKKRSAFVSIFAYVMKQSYVFALIVMMVSNARNQLALFSKFHFPGQAGKYLSQCLSLINASKFLEK